MDLKSILKLVEWICLGVSIFTALVCYDGVSRVYYLFLACVAIYFTVELVFFAMLMSGQEGDEYIDKLLLIIGAVEILAFGIVSLIFLLSGNTNEVGRSRSKENEGTRNMDFLDFMVCGCGIAGGAVMLADFIISFC